MAPRKLTTRAVESITTQRDREDIPDALVPGLQLRVTSLHGPDKKRVPGSKSWALRYTRKSDGRRRRLTLGTFPAMSLEEARNRAREELAAVQRGGDPASGVAERKAALTFREIADEWIKRHGEPNKSARALRDDRSMLERHILPKIGHLKGREITKRDLLAMLDAVAQKDDARNKAGAEARKMTHRPNRVFELVRAILRWAVGRDLIQDDPSAGLSPPIKKERPRERVLSPEEIRTLWRALDAAPVLRPMKRSDGDVPMTRATALALGLALATAQRIGEVTGIALSELDLNDTAPMWTIPGERSKNGEAHRVPLSPLAVRMISEAIELGGGSPWLFPSPRGSAPMGSHAPTRAVDRARVAIGLEDFRCHDLRRTAATCMAEAGINPHTISVVLNHVSAQRGTITGKVYNRYSYDREKREALAAWGERLERIIESQESHNVIKFGAR